MFATARLEHHGASIEWGLENGDLAIDAHHLRLIADEQRGFGCEEVASWQATAGLSNQEAADFLGGGSLSTWNAYKGGYQPGAGNDLDDVPSHVARSDPAAGPLPPAEARPSASGR